MKMKIVIMNEWCLLLCFAGPVMGTILTLSIADNDMVIINANGMRGPGTGLIA